MIEIKNISKRYGANTVIDNLKLKIKTGEIVGLLGPNGAGKTTTLRMVAGVLPPSEGSIIINGRDINMDGLSVRENIGFLPENNPLFEEMTVWEYLEFFARIKGLTRKRTEEAFDFVLENCGIGEVIYRPIAELSKGFRQRVGLSQALLTKPDILILDEPTEGLDPNQRHDIAGLIKTLGRKRTVLISSHVLNELSRITTRMIIIHKGKVAADATPDNLLRMGMEKGIIEAEIKGSGVIKVLGNLKNVVLVRKSTGNIYEVVTKGKEDIRESIYDASVRNKWKMLAMTSKSRDIEDVFQSLTNG